MPTITPDDLTAAEFGALWLLDVEWEGVTYRWASQLPDGVALVITDEDSNDIEYLGGLELGWRDDFDLFSESGAPPVLSLPIPFGEIEDVPQRIADGADLTTMTASLYRWAPGMTYERRVPVFFGLARDPSYGSTAEDVRVSFESPIYRDGLTWVSGRIDANHIDSIDSGKDTGDPYPVVFGGPAYTGGTGAERTGAPAYVIDGTNRYLVAGILYDSSPSAVYDADGTSVTITTTTEVSDNKGNEYSRVTLGATGFDADADYWIEYSATGRGTSAEDLILLCAESSSLKVDHDELRTRAGALDSYLFAGYVDTDVSPWEWCLRNVIALLPCSPYYTPSGISIRLWDPTAGTDDVELNLNPDEDPIVRVGPVQYENAPIRNEITVRYKPDRDGNFRAQRTVTGRRDYASTDETVVFSQFAAASVTRLRAIDAAGPRQGVRSHVIETPFVYDDATAARIALWQARMYAKPRRTVTYAATDGTLEWLDVGALVTITDAEIALSSQLAIVRSREWRADNFFITLVLIDDITR